MPNNGHDNLQELSFDGIDQTVAAELVETFVRSIVRQLQGSPRRFPDINQLGITEGELIDLLRLEGRVKYQHTSGQLCPDVMGLMVAIGGEEYFFRDYQHLPFITGLKEEVEAGSPKSTYFRRIFLQLVPNPPQLAT